MGAYPTSCVPRAIQKVGVVERGLADVGDLDFRPAIRAALQNAMSLLQVLETLGERFPAIECLRYLCGIGTRKLEVRVSANREDRRPRLCRELVKELVGGDDTDTELAGFGEHRLNAVPGGHEVLDLVAVNGEERAFRTGEERVLK